MMFLKKTLKRIKKELITLYIKVLLKIKRKNSIDIEDNYDLLENAWKNKNVSCYRKKRRIFKNEIDLSIIVPLYNSEKFLKQLISHIINQKTNYEYELILINDGSKDDTISIIKKYALEYPNLIKTLSFKNEGISSARNHGLDISRGKYISFLDHDDYISDNFVEEILTTAYKHDADIVKCGTVNVKNNKIISSCIFDNAIIEGEMGTKILNYPSYIWGGVYKASFFEKVDFPVGFWYEDMITRFLLYRQCKKFISISEIMHYRTIHKEQTSSLIWNNKNFRCLEQLYLLENLINDNYLFGLKEDAYLYLNILLECSDIMVRRICGLDEQYKKQVFKRVYLILSRLYKEEYLKKMTSYWKVRNNIILEKRYDLWLLEKYL